jgi:hypothetical protein
MFNTEGTFLFVSLPPMPMLKRSVSANASAGLWQLAQLTVESFDKIFSENSLFPKAALVEMLRSSGAIKLLTAITNPDKAKKQNPIFIATKIQMIPTVFLD